MYTFVLRNRGRTLEINPAENEFRAWSSGESGEPELTVVARPDFSTICVMRIAIKAFLDEGPEGFSRVALFFTYGRKANEISFAVDDENDRVRIGIGLTNDRLSLRIFVSKYHEEKGRWQTVVVVVNRIRTAGLYAVIDRMVMRSVEIVAPSPSLDLPKPEEIPSPFTGGYF